MLVLNVSLLRLTHVCVACVWDNYVLVLRELITYNIESPYKLMDRRSGLADHRVGVGDTEVGKNNPYIIAGPCTIDPANPNLYLESAHALKEAGVHALRGGV